MKSPATTTCETSLARSLAGEDLRPGDYVTILSEIVEWPSFYWVCDSQVWPPNEPVRIQRHSADGGTPLKIKAICLPFVFVKKPSGEHRLLDLRQHRLVRLSPDYARDVWKAMSKPKTTASDRYSRE